MRAAPLALMLSLVLALNAHADARGAWLAVVSGAVTSGLGYVIWYAARPGLGALRAATVQLSVPLIAAMGGVLLIAETPTLRLVLAGIAILGGIALGREAISLRLVAVGALVVLLFRPEAIGGASFQMSFAAVTSIIVLHHWQPVRDLLSPREEGLPMRALRGFLGLILTGLVVEVALMPFALYHFHKAGLYSVGANLVAIPLTTFIVMPLEAGALVLDAAGLGAPLWAGVGWSIDLMLELAHRGDPRVVGDALLDVAKRREADGGAVRRFDL